VTAELRANQTPVSRTVHVVVPDGVDDPSRPSGGNTYDRQVCRSLTVSGWDVCEHKMAGTWPSPAVAAEEALRQAMSEIPYDGLVLVDGLIASTAPDILVPAARRLRLVVLVHMPLGLGALPDDASATARERAVLSAARAVVTTSSWTREQLLDEYALSPDEVHVAEPGVRPARVAPGTTDGGALLCVAAVTPGKGHADLLTALVSIKDLPWHCVCVGALDRAPEFVAQLRQRAEADGIAGRVDFVGPRAGEELNSAYAAADVLVLASHAETYGMVVTEALARGLPVVATAVGGVPLALGWAPDGQRPGVLVEPGQPRALASALRGWLLDADLRQRLRDAARQRRGTLSGWDKTADQIAHVLQETAR
jgi:glycosyltransferase involved in cell wall biosynthesis